MVYTIPLLINWVMMSSIRLVVGFFFFFLNLYFQQEEVSAAEELVKTSLERVEDPDVNVQQAWERKLVVTFF